MTTNSLDSGAGEIGDLLNGMTAAASPFASSNGCGDVNQTFGNFFVNGFTSLAGTYADTSNSITGVAKAITFQTAIPGTSDTTNDFTSGAGSVSGDIVYLTQFGTGASPSLASPSIEYLVVELTGVNLPSLDSSQDPASIALSITACENVTAAMMSNFTTCSSGTLVQLGVVTFSNNSGINITNGIETAILALGTSFSNINVNTQITLTANNNGAASFMGLTESFDSPEPSTFILIGTALAGIGILRFRKRERQL